MHRAVVGLAVTGLLVIFSGCGKEVVEGSVQVTSTDAFKRLKGNPPRPPVVPQR